MTVKHRHPVVELTIPEYKTGIYEGSPGLPSNESITGEAMRFLKTLYGGLGRRSEVAGRIGSGAETQGKKPVLDIPD